MAVAVTLVASGGVPITNAASLTALAQPMTPVASGGVAVTVVNSGGLPVVLVNEDGGLFYQFAGLDPYHYWDFTTNRALFAGSDIGAVTSTPSWSASHALDMTADGLNIGTANPDVITAGVGSANYPLTLFAEWFQPVDPAATGVILQLDDGDSSDRVQLAVSALPAWQTLVTTGSAAQAAIQEGTPVFGVVCKMAVRIATDSVRMCVNGTLYTEDTTATLPAAPTTMRFGTQHTGAFQLQGRLRRVAIIAASASDAQLQAMTT